MKKLIWILFALPVMVSGQSMFIFCGQSNMRGYGVDSLSVVPDSGVAFEYDWPADKLRELRDPVGDSTGTFQRAVSGSLIPSFAQRFHELTGDTVFAVACGKGGSPLVSGGWSGSLKWNMVSKTNAAISKTGIQPSGIVWLQGERDGTDLNNGLVSRDQYRDSLISLRDYWRSNLGADLPFFIIPIGLNTLYSDSGYNEIRAAQYEVAAGDSNTWIVYDSTNLFPQMGLMSDKVHYSQEGYNRVGYGAAESVASILAGNCRGVDPVSFQFVTSANPSPGFTRIEAAGSGPWVLRVVSGSGFKVEYSGNAWPGSYNVSLSPGLYLIRLEVVGAVQEFVVVSY